MDVKGFNEWTILSLLVFLAGILFYIYWGITYNVWTDIGIYSITIVFVFSGICGVLLSFIKKKEDLE